jgi:hypothetical protein
MLSHEWYQKRLFYNPWLWIPAFVLWVCEAAVKVAKWYATPELQSALHLQTIEYVLQVAPVAVVGLALITVSVAMVLTPFGLAIYGLVIVVRAGWRALVAGWHRP